MMTQSTSDGSGASKEKSDQDNLIEQMVREKAAAVKKATVEKSKEKEKDDIFVGAADIFENEDGNAARRWQPQTRPWSAKVQVVEHEKTAELAKNPPLVWKENYESKVTVKMAKRKAMQQYVVTGLAMLGLFFALLENRQCIQVCTTPEGESSCSLPPVTE